MSEIDWDLAKRRAEALREIGRGFDRTLDMLGAKRRSSIGQVNTQLHHPFEASPTARCERCGLPADAITHWRTSA